MKYVLRGKNMFKIIFTHSDKEMSVKHMFFDGVTFDRGCIVLKFEFEIS